MQWAGTQRVKGPLKTVFSLSLYAMVRVPRTINILSPTVVRETQSTAGNQSLDISSLGTANCVVSRDTLGPPCNTFLIFSM